MRESLFAWVSMRMARQATLHPMVNMPLFEFTVLWIETQIATGEIAAITNCTNILTDPNGKFRLTATEAAAAFTDLSLYTNAESCPMVRNIPGIYSIAVLY
jgi:methylaspartate ammonia-lyase